VETILGDILTWSWFSEPHGYNFNGLLIPDAAGNICIDPVEPGDEVLNELARRGVSQIVLTNRNHVRAANRVRERTAAKILIHPLTQPERSSRALSSTANYAQVHRLDR
jgi:glyoxylase-like metal-dependent hydrolase (beta-lactamase superfamily II)